MIIVTKQGEKQDLPYLYAYEDGLFSYPFYGDETYTDPFDGSVWFWDVDNDVDEIIGVVNGTVRLIRTTSVNDCKALEKSYFWDDDTGVLYVHWTNNVNDYTTGKDLAFFTSVVEGYASGQHEITNNIFGGVYYPAVITAIGGLSRNVDPLKFGVLSHDESSLSITNQNGQYDNLDPTQVIGQPVFFYKVEDDDTELTDDMKIFTGTYSDFKNSKVLLNYKIEGNRLFDNVPVCPNTLSLDDYPSAGSMEGAVIPTPWGDIRRGKMLLTNEDDLTTAGTETATYLIADPSLDAVKVITAIYDEDGNSFPILSSSLTGCTISITKPADISTSQLKKWSWEGQGYDIDGTYNNGLDIIKDAFLKLADIPYLESTFNVTEWDAATTANPEDIGDSIQSTKGFTEQLIQPVTVSLQGILEIQGDGRISWKDRDITASPSATVNASSQQAEPVINEDSSQMVSELVVEYSQNFVDKDDKLIFINSDNKDTVISQYSIDRRDPLSPVKTLLFTESDASDISDEIMSTSASPNRIVDYDSLDLSELRVFDVVCVDTGRFGVEDLEYGEILSVAPDYINVREKNKMRVIPGYTP